MSSSADPDAMVREAQRLQRLDRVREAIEAYQRVLARWPTLADCWFNLGVLQRKARQLSEALSSYQRALDLGISSPEEVHLNRAVIYADYLRQDAAAERELQVALALNPTYVPAMLNLANLHEDLGRREQARELYERLLSHQPDCLEALARLANLHAVADDGLVQRLKAALQSPAASAAERASLGFALGRLLDASGQYAAAFDAYTAANRESRASAPPGTAPYDHQRHEQLVDRLIRATTPQTGAALQRHTSAAATARAAVRSPAPLPPGPRPIFICGLFRSGSTLTERLLCGHPQVTAGGELDMLPRLAHELTPFPEILASLSAQQAAALAARYRSELTRLFPGAGYVTDKRPDNFLLIGLIKRLFPEARIVHTVRNPLDNCLSIFFLHLDQRMSYALELMDIGHYVRQYRRLMSHWKSLFGADIFDLDYDLLVREPQSHAARLFEFLGLEWDERYLAFPRAAGAVKTASVWQVREPLYTRSSGRAAHYSAQLAALREYLADVPAK